MKFHVARDQGRRTVHTTVSDAKAIDPNFISIDIPTDKPGLMEWYQQQLDAEDAKNEAADEAVTDADHEDAVETAEAAPAAASGEITAAAILALPSNELSILVEEIFDSLPIMTQLHYGSRAIEEARDQIGGPSIQPARPRSKKAKG